jgi:phage tail sheath protein FI
MPGVVISTSVRTGPSTATVRESSQLFVVGLAQRGPSNEAVLVESLAEFEDIFGEYRSDSYLHPTVETFFEEGGTRAYVARSVGASATAGELTLLNGDNDVITLTANGAGSWSEDVDIQVINSNTSFRILVYFEDNLVYSTGNVTSSSQAVGRINSSAVASRYLSAAVDNVNLLPSTIAATSLSAGSALDTSLDEDDFNSSLLLFNDALGVGAVACPENQTEAMNEYLTEHANAYNRIALLSGPETQTVAQAKAAAFAVRQLNHAEHSAYYYPWVEIPTSIAGITKMVPPVGYVAAKRAVAHNQSGTHTPAAGLISTSRFVTGVKFDVDKTVGDDLDENSVNAIRVIQNTVRIYGARSCSIDTDNFKYITQQDVVNTIVAESYLSLEDLVFSPIDGRNEIFSNISARLVSVLATMRDTGALYPAYDSSGRLLDPGFVVKCDKTINPTSQLNDGLIKARIGLRVSSVGDQIEIDIVKSNLTTSVV